MTMTFFARFSFKWAAVATLACVISCTKNDTTPAVISHEVLVQDFSTSRGTLRIGGKVYSPKGVESKKPAAILCHGLFGSYAMMEPYAVAAAQKGFVAVCFDFCGGPAGESLSGGDVKDNSVLTEIEDVKAVYDALSTRPDVDDGRIVVIGASQGGLVAAMYAAQNPARVKALGLFFPAFNLPEYVKAAVDLLYDGDVNKVPEEGVGIELDKEKYIFSKKYVLDSYNLDPYKTIGKYTGNVNIIHGDNDIVVPIEYTRNALKVYKNAHLDIMEGQGHVFDDAGTQKAAGILQEWLVEVVKN